MQRATFLKTLGLGLAGAAISQSPLFASLAQLPHSSDTKHWIWISRRDVERITDWDRLLGELAGHHLHGILLNARDEVLEKVLPIAQKVGIKVHKWMWALNQAHEANLREQHPEWFSVSREGKSCATHPPYVDYYRWLCPSKEEVKEHLHSQVRHWLQYSELAGIHLDYIRHPDVILPKGLWKNYNLIQTTEFPQFDFCYCDTCRTQFQEEGGQDPLKMDDPTQSEEWRRFRWDSVTKVVNSIAPIVQGEGKMLSAAVFPTPTEAKKLVRQAWDEWQVDAVFPMMYHNFYEENLTWIHECSREGAAAMKGKPVYAGLFVPSLSPKELPKAVDLAIEGGASGVALFSVNSPSDRHWKKWHQQVIKIKK